MAYLISVWCHVFSFQQEDSLFATMPPLCPIGSHSKVQSPKSVTGGAGTFTKVMGVHCALCNAWQQWQRYFTLRLAINSINVYLGEILFCGLFPEFLAELINVLFRFLSFQRWFSLLLIFAGSLLVYTFCVTNQPEVAGCRCDLSLQSLTSVFAHSMCMCFCCLKKAILR